MDIERLKQLLVPKLTKYIPIELTPKQTAFLLLKCEDAFYGGAAGGGKSYALLATALQYVDCPGYNSLILRDTYKNLTMPEAIMDVAFQWLLPTDAKWNEEKKTWTFPSGARLTFGYIDGPRDHFNYLSSAFHNINFDEVVAFRENQALYLFSRLRKEKNDPIPLRFRCGSNPPTREQIARGQWVKDRYVDPITRKKDAVFIPAKMEDNPHLDSISYKKGLKNLDPVTRRQLEEGDWEIREKGGMFDRSWFEIVDVAPIEANRVRYWDLAATKPQKNQEPAYTAGVKIAKDNYGIYYIESIIRFRKEPRYVEQMIRQTADMDGKSIAIWMEREPGSSGVNTVDHYRRHILPEFNFRGDQVTGSKYDRAAPFSSQCEAGNVKLVRGHWNHEFFEEIEVFPEGKFKDQVDAAAGAFDKLAMERGLFRVRVV